MSKEQNHLFLEKIKEKLNISDIPDIVLFVGDGTIDGHGVLIEEEAYGFFELTTLKNSLSSYHAEVFLVHEIIHPIHYQLNKDFSPQNWNSVEEYYFKRLICEGIATYFSKNVISTLIEEAYWFGYLKQDELNEWINYCKEARHEISKKLKRSLKEKKLDSNLYRQLFCILGNEKLTQFRLGYYYGSQIMEKINKKFTFEQIINLEYKDLRYYILNYFDIN